LGASNLTVDAMYLFRVFHSFLPLRNPIGFGAADFVVLAVALLMVLLLVAKVLIAPYAHKLAPHTVWSMCLLFLLPVLLRLLLLPNNPVPIPSSADDFSYALLGDTLRHLRLANPTHPMHQFFEAVFVLQQPAYASIYPLGQGILLALGKFAFQSYWSGVLLASGTLCALCYWMLRAWVAPAWALLGGFLTIIEFGPLNPWVNTYWGGSLSAIAGCLVFGSLPRLCRSPRMRDGLFLGLGFALQILTRPFEVIFLAIAAGSYLAGAYRLNLARASKPASAALGVIVAAFGLTLLQNKAVTSSWTTLPYMLSRYEYGVPATFTFQPNALPHRQLTPEQELDFQAQAAIHGPGTDSLSSYFSRLAYRSRYLRFFILPPLYFALVVLLPNFRERRYLWLAGTILLFALGTNVYPYFFPHYIAAVTCLFILLSVLALEKLGSNARLSVLLPCFLSFSFWFALYLSGDEDLLSITNYQTWNYINRGDSQGREAIRRQLSRAPGQQLIFIRYSPAHRFEEWVHNDADIDAAQIVWANDLGADENRKLLRYYPARTAWLLEPDLHPVALLPYPKEPEGFLPVQ
jgi:hypothetical protein